MTEKVNEILEGLNEEQRKAVSCVEGPVLIVAGAGSGKTKVLTSRIAYLLAGGVDPTRILALTFTKKAAGEMQSRIASMVGASKARRLVMGTFHAVFVRFLREYAESLGYPGRFTIYDTSDSTSAVKACIKELGLDDKIYKPKEVLSRISMAKNNLITVSAYRGDRDQLTRDGYAKKPRLVDLYDLYQKKLKQSGAMDFDDILLNMNVLLKSNQDALLSISDRFSYIMVDEYQDTNYAQYLIMRKLAQFHRNLCVVGDDSQSIYAFRGARIENILKFRTDYPEYKIFRLERNYRSTKTIVDAANSVIAHNAGRIPKNCYSEAEAGEKIKIVKCYTEMEEAVEIVAQISSRMQRDKAQYQDFAILYRTNAQSRAIEEQLRRRNIPYMIYSGNSFFDRMEVKDLMAYFKLCVNPYDDESFRRIANKPARGIGATSMAALELAARSQGCCFMQAARQMPKFETFCKMIDSLSAEVRSTDAHQMATKIADTSGLYAFFKSDTSIEGLSRTANIEELVNSVALFVEERMEEAEDELEAGTVFTLDDYLENITLLSNVDVASDEDSSNKVALMTVHSAKGLEFPYVFIAGLEENLFPGTSAQGIPSEMEEERRLFYVAITRAEKAVSLLYAVSRMRNGKHESNPPSRFIKDIDSQYLDSPLDDSEFDLSGASREYGSEQGFRFGSGSYGSSNNGGSYGSNSYGGGSSRGTSYGRNTTSYGSSNRYGGSSSVRYEKKPGSPTGTLRPSTNPSAASRPAASSVVVPSSAPASSAEGYSTLRASQLSVGQRLEHNRFGPGTVESISGSGDDSKLAVRFDEHGLKLLILRYAKFKIV